MGFTIVHPPVSIDLFTCSDFKVVLEPLTEAPQPFAKHSPFSGRAIAVNDSYMDAGCLACTVECIVVRFDEHWERFLPCEPMKINCVVSHRLFTDPPCMFPKG